MSYLLLFLLGGSGAILIFIVLLQRGRGGGLAGAFGGVGGQSAFGVRAGDVFTKITVGVTVVWVLLAGFSGIVLRAEAEKFQGGDQVGPKDPAVKTAEPSQDGAAGKTDDKAAPKDSAAPTPSSTSTDKADPAPKSAPAGKTESGDKTAPKSGETSGESSK